MKEGQRMNQWIARDLEHIWHPCSQMKDYEQLPPIIIDRAQGVYVMDMEGKAYMDVVSSWWCNLLGHCNPRINRAVKNQIDRIEHVIFANFSHKPAIALCSRLSELVPGALNKFFFTDNGSSAVEAAMKMSFQYHYQTGNRQKTRFMALEGAYHGETIGALSAGGVDIYSKMYKPLLMDIIRVEAPDCYRCRYGKCRDDCDCQCFDSVERNFEQYGEQTSAILAEPIVQAAAGMRIYPPLFLKKLRKACDKFSVHLIADEIAAGFGRTGTMFACEQADIVPDIMCISKGLTGGYLPMAMAVTSDTIYNAFYDDYNKGTAFLHSHTYCANPLACAAALEVLNIFEEESILEKAQEKKGAFHKMVKAVMEELPWVGEVRHTGLINAVELVKDRKQKTAYHPQARYGYQIYKKALEKGVILRPLGDVIYFNPPLIIKPEEMEYAVRTAKECIYDVLKNAE